MLIGLGRMSAGSMGARWEEKRAAREGERVWSAVIFPWFALSLEEALVRDDLPERFVPS